MRITAFVSAIILAIGLGVGSRVTANDGEGTAYSPELAALNDALLAAGRTDIAIDKAELLFAGTGAGDQATTVVANDRTHLLSSQFVEDDPRRGSPANTITYLVDQSDGSALSWAAVSGGAIVVLPNEVTEPELDRSMAAWGGMPCNGPAMAKVTDSGADPDLVDGLVQPTLYTVGTPFADITHAGWLPGAFFNALVPGGASSILAVTLTFVFTDANGVPTDVDGDGRADVAFREIYYNRSFPWGTGGNPRNVDIQSVAIHEAGHGLGLAHFGKIAIKNNGTLQFAPRAIMNAAYVAEDRTIRGTDNGSFCHIWANSH